MGPKRLCWNGSGPSSGSEPGSRKRFEKFTAIRDIPKVALSEHVAVKEAPMHSNAVRAAWKPVCHAFNLHYLDGVRVRKGREEEEEGDRRRRANHDRASSPFQK